MYPCQCSAVPGSVTTSPCPSGNCLEVASFTVNPTTSIAPCDGSEAIIDVGALSDVTACTGTVQWVIDSFDVTIFDTVTVSSLGVVSAVSSGAGAVGTPYEITGRAVCSNSILSQHFKITFLFKDLCSSLVCADGETCDKCFGCVPTAPNVTLE